MKKKFSFGLAVVFLCLAGSMVLGNHAAAGEEGDMGGLTPKNPVQTIFGGLEMTIEGLIEVEAGYEKKDVKDNSDPENKDGRSSEITLATVELGIEALVNSFITGRILFLYEEEPDADIEVDESYIGIQKEGCPYYLTIGRQYIPFGYFESHFISDPLTLELGETRETSLVAGYENDAVDLFLGFFNGDADETNEDDDHIDNYVAGFAIRVPEMSFGNLVFGGSYLSNIADSDALADEIDTTEGTIDEKVAGYSFFVSLMMKDALSFEGEFLGATDNFEAGELSFDGGKSYKPQAWNVELSYMLTGSMELALRWGGSSDGGDFLPETLYGGCFSCEVLKNTFVAAEILTGEYENHDEAFVATSQLAVIF